MDRINIKSGIYVVAVSGGVDSVVLLDKLARQGQPKLIVAHFDHGIRPDSRKDREFVQQLAKNYGLSFEYTEGKLGAGASEASARKARYDFLNKVKNKYHAAAIVTAHHQDDVIETAIINILRGTKRKGLSSLRSKPGVLRPLLGDTKFTIVKYGTSRHLKWREDPTNQDTKYLRNYVRLVLIPKLDDADSSWRERFLSQIEQASQLNQVIEPMLQQLDSRISSQDGGKLLIGRDSLIELPGEVGQELVRHWLVKSSSKQQVDKKIIKHAWLFAKTAKSGSTLSLSRDLTMKIDQGQVILAKISK